MKRADLLIVIISDEHDALRDTAEEKLKNDRNVDVLLVCPSQIALINERLSGNKQNSDVLIICEKQMKVLECYNKLWEVLYSCEKHGAAVSLNVYSRGISLKKEQYEKISQYLDEYRVIPYIESTPVLIKAEVFERFGLFDEGFPSITGALVDFSLRFNQYGWSIVRVNCWSDGGAYAGELSVKERDILFGKYSYIPKIEEIYYIRAEKAVEHFADVLMRETDHKPSLLFSLYEVPSSFNGTANYALKLLAAFWDICHEKYEISILVKESADEFYKLSEKYPRVYYPEAVRRHTFRLGYVASQVLCAEHMDIINRCCLKYCVCMLDIICLRSHYLCKNDLGRLELFRDSIEYADLMLSISRFSHDDIIGFFYGEIQNADVRTGVLYLGTDEETPAAAIEEIDGPFRRDDYFIVIGNTYRHKMIEPVLEILKTIEENFIVIGTKTEGYYPKSRRIYGYVSGWLDQDRLHHMIAGSKGIIFPSVYEGFGLTLYDAAVFQKKLIASDTQVNLELKALLGEYEGEIITYRCLQDLRNILSENDFGNRQGGTPVDVRNWQEVAKELDNWMEDMHGEETDTIRLERRWKYLKRYETERSHSATKKSNVRKERLIGKCISSFPRTYQLYRKVVTAIDKEHYGSH